MRTLIHVIELEEVHFRTSAAVSNSLLAPSPTHTHKKTTLIHVKIGGGTSYEKCIFSPFYPTHQGDDDANTR